MAISFSCNQCGNDYVVSDGLAGKSAICKACGARMTVPGGAAPADEPADVEAIDEPASTEATAAPAPAPPPRKPAAPTFAAPTPKGASGGSKLLRLLVLVAAVAVAVYSRAGRSTRTDVRGLYQQQVDLNQRVNDILKDVKDVPSAKAASGPLKQVLQEQKDFTDKIRNRKANKADIEAVEAEFGPKKEALHKQFIEEMIRVAVIPGVTEALDLKSMPGAADDEPESEADKPAKKD
ncbi:MAG TPA: hypothetical protein VGH33_11875 [Isosphaeraceae bacterium]|jgi:hypothetical protein